MSEESSLLPSRGLQLAQTILNVPVPQLEDRASIGAWDTVRQQQRAKSAQEAYDARVKQLWADFGQDYCSRQDLDEALWTSIDGMRVIDIPALYEDALFLEAVSSTWGDGRPYQSVPPRVSHALDLAAFLAAYILQISYVLHPPALITISRVDESFGAREVFLVILSLRLRLSSALTLLAFVSALPDIPFPGRGLPFTLLLLSTGIYTFQLHMPTTPSPLFMLSPASALPPIFALRAVMRKLRPMLMLIPLVLLCAFLVSTSLVDTFTRIGIEPDLLVYATPIETRSALLLIAFLSLCTLIAAFFLLSLSSASPAEREWHEPFYNTCKKYAEDHYYFPPPLAFVGPILKHLPSIYTKWVWRIFIGPFAYPAWAVMRYLPFLMRISFAVWPLVLFSVVD